MRNPLQCWFLLATAVLFPAMLLASDAVSAPAESHARRRSFRPST